LLLFRANPGIKSDKLESPLDICKMRKMEPFLERGRILSITLPMIGNIALRERIWHREGYMHFDSYDDENY
jgi:hypothetical protein